IPVVNEFMRKLLTAMGISEADAKLVINSRIPFEASMAYIAEYFNTDFILSGIFGKGSMNTNHLFVARLASLGMVKNVYTTNWDLLQEGALKEYGVDFEVVDYTRSTSASTKEFQYHKIHGSIDNHVQ